MKALIVTDLHLRPAYIEKARLILEIIEQKIEELKPEYLINLGDTFHSKNTTYVSVTNLYENFLRRVAKKVKVINLVGNHDWATQYTDHSLDSFKDIENVTIVDDVFVLGENAFIAYCREKDRFKAMLDKAGPRIVRIFAHMDMDDFTPGSGWEEISPFFKAEDFTRYEQVISGHLHLAQEKKLENGTEIIFAGSGYTTDFGESDQEKRFLLFDLRTGEYESIPLNTTFHKTLQMKTTDPFPKIDLEEVKRGVEYRVIITGTKEEYASLIFPKNYPAKPIPNFTSAKGARIELSASDTQEDTMKKYVKTEIERTYGGLDKSGFDIEKLVKFGKRFIPND